MRPTEEIFNWAEDELDPQNFLTKVSPPPEIQQTGLKRGQPIARVWMNYMFHHLAAYVSHLANDAVGTVKITTTASNISPNTEYGGTWTTTTDTIGGVAVDIHTKTAL